MGGKRLLENSAGAGRKGEGVREKSGAVSGAAVGSLSHRLLGEVRTPLLVVH